jgi:hypothetical protein
MNNVSDTPICILHEPWFQPSNLVFAGDTALTIRIADERSTMVMSTMKPGRMPYVLLSPGSVLGMDSGGLQRETHGLYAMQWGYYCYRDIQPGIYTVYLEWMSVMDEWVDGDTQGAFDDVWKSSVQSEPLTIELPL